MGMGMGVGVGRGMSSSPPPSQMQQHQQQQLPPPLPSLPSLPSHGHHHLAQSQSQDMGPMGSNSPPLGLHIHHIHHHNHSHRTGQQQQQQQQLQSGGSRTAPPVPFSSITNSIISSLLNPPYTSSIASQVDPLKSPTLAPITSSPSPPRGSSIPIIRIVPDRPPPNLGTFVYPSTPLPLPVMPVPPTWSTLSAFQMERAAEKEREKEKEKEKEAAAEEPTVNTTAASVVSAPSSTTMLTTSARSEKERKRAARLEERERERRERDREAALNGGAGASGDGVGEENVPAMIVPAPMYAFTLLIPSGALLEEIPDVVALWGTQGSAPAFGGSATGSGRRGSGVSVATVDNEDKDKENGSGEVGVRGSDSAPEAAPVPIGAGDMWEGTIGYTDDSDIRLMVLHAGFVSLEEMRAAKLGSVYVHPSSSPFLSLSLSASTSLSPALKSSKGRGKEPSAPVPGVRRDLAVSLLWRGVKSRYKGSVGSIAGGAIRSASWGTSHDGGALEIERVEWLPVCASYHVSSPIAIIN